MNDAERLEHRRHNEIHDCVVPGCRERARTAFLAAEDGWLAGAWWRAGDFIDLCWPHADRVYSGIDPSEEHARSGRPGNLRWADQPTQYRNSRSALART